DAPAMSELRRNSTHAPREAPRQDPRPAPASLRNLIRSNSFAETLGKASGRLGSATLSDLLSSEPPHDLHLTKGVGTANARPGAEESPGLPRELGEAAPVEDGSRRHVGEEAEHQ